MVGCRLIPCSRGSLNSGMNIGLILKQWETIEEFKTQGWWKWRGMFFKVPPPVLACIDWRRTCLDTKDYLGSSDHIKDGGDSIW